MFDVETLHLLCVYACRVSPPSLHANEEMLSEDSEEEEMDSRETPITVNNRKLLVTFEPRSIANDL